MLLKTSGNGNEESDEQNIGNQSNQLQNNTYDSTNTASFDIVV